MFLVRIVGMTEINEQSDGPEDALGGSGSESGNPWCHNGKAKLGPLSCDEEHFQSTRTICTSRSRGFR